MYVYIDRKRDFRQILYCSSPVYFYTVLQYCKLPVQHIIYLFS